MVAALKQSRALFQNSVRVVRSFKGPRPATTVAAWIALLILHPAGQVVAHAQVLTFTSAVSLLDNTAYSPQGIAADANGNVYIADTGSGRVLKVTTSGLQSVQTAIVGLQGPVGIAVDNNGALYIADAGRSQLLKETPSGGSYSQTVISTDLSTPWGVAVDNLGNIYVADVGNNRIVKETPASSSYIQTTILSNLSYPEGIAVDTAGNLYLADENNNRVLKETLSNGAYVESVLATGFSSPQGVAVDSLGNVLVADSRGNRLVEETPSGTSYTQSVLATGLNIPVAVAVAPSGRIFVTQSNADGVDEVQVGAVDLGTVHTGFASRRATLTFTFSGSTSVGSVAVVTQGTAGLDFVNSGGICAGNGPANSFSPGSTCTVSVTFKPLFSGARYGAALIYDNSGNLLATGYLQGNGYSPQVTFPPGIQSTLLTLPPSTYYQIAMDGNGSLYIADATNNRVIKETPFAGGYSQSIIITGLNNPQGLAIDGAGNIYVSSSTSLSGQVLKFVPTLSGYMPGSVVSVAARNPQALAVDGSGNIFIVDNSGNRVYKVSVSNGVYTQSTVGTNLYLPTAVAVDLAGNVYIADVNTAVNSNIGNGWVIKETPSNGTYVQSTVASGFVLATGLTVDGNGNLYVSDFEGGTGYAGAAYKETLSGGSYLQTTLGNNLNRPWSSAVDGNGNVYIIGTSQIVEEDLSDPAAITFAATTVGHTSTDSPKSVTVANSGNAPMNVPIPTVGTNPLAPSGFAIDDTVSSACPFVSASSPQAGSLDAGTSCNLTIGFSPQSSSDTSGWLTYTYDGPNETSSNYRTAGIPLIAAGSKLTPAITWPNPTNITYGTKLDTTQLNANANVPGAFAYSPGFGTLLSAGPHTLSVSFTPSDGSDFTSASSQVTLNVNQATPAITWPAPSPITYGTTLSSAQLNASAAVAGSFSYSPAAGASLSPGTYTLGVTFTPTDAIDYATTTAQVSLVVNKATPIISWATPPAITYGTVLSSTQLNATASVPGTFYYGTGSGTLLAAGSHVLSVTFYPTDSVDYASTTANVTLVVNKATPAITWSAPAAIIYGTPLAATQLNATSPTPGTFAYSPAPGTILAAGSRVLTVNFTPIDSTNFNLTTASVTLVVNQAAPQITWTPPAAITYGTPLSATQLNATASVPGTFVYSPAAGTVLAAGSNALSATFTPNDSTDYKSVTASANLVVNKAMPTITWATPAAITYGTPLSATQLNATASVPGTFVYNPPAGTVLGIGSSSLSVSFTPADSTDYFGANATVAISVVQPVPVISSISPAIQPSGGSAFTLTLNGAGFTAASVAYWGSTALTTQYVTGTQVTAQVPATAIATSGVYSVSVQNPAPGGGTSNTWQFEVDTAGANATPTFNTNSVSVARGSTASYPVTLPSSASNVSVSCLNLPAGTTCNYSATTQSLSISTSSTTPSGTYQITVVFNETLPGAAASLVLFPALLLPLGRKRRNVSRWLFLFVVILVLAGTMNGCGGSSSSSSSTPPPVTHDVKSSATVTLIVQ